ncbi:MAG: Asp-tRNA(Asn)/Glu-tRNA(Gln) amidotransferase subunit GatC [Bacteriovoracia bacterium]
MITNETTKKLADLARLELNDEREIEKITSQISRVLEYVKKLSEIDTSNVEPLANPRDMSARLREDQIVSFDGASVVKCAPEVMYDNFKVPQVISGKKTSSSMTESAVDAGGLGDLGELGE